MSCNNNTNLVCLLNTFSKVIEYTFIFMFATICTGILLLILSNITKYQDLILIPSKCSDCVNEEQGIKMCDSRTDWKTDLDITEFITNSLFLEIPF